VTPNIKRKTNKFLCQVPFFFVSFAGRRLQTKYETTIPYDIYSIMSYIFGIMCGVFIFLTESLKRYMWLNAHNVVHKVELAGN
jgi:hypothetical protein